MIQIVPVGEKGLAITFSKDDLKDIKEGKTLNGELVNASGKTKVMFMRDRTFKEMLKRFSKKRAGAVADINNTNEALSLAHDLAEDTATQD